MKENAFTHYIRDEVLYQRFKDAAREDKLPILDNKTLKDMVTHSKKNKNAKVKISANRNA